MRWYGRLRRKGEIAQVRRRGKRIALTSVTAFALPADHGGFRVAISASKSVGKAVIRNLVRRRIRGALDALGPAGVSSGRLFLIIRDEAGTLPYERIAEDVRVLLGKLGR